MRIGLFSDIHSNLDALETVVRFLRNAGIKDFIFCGDIVGYGPQPNECIDMIRNLPNVKIVAGNHDRAAVGMKDPNWFNPAAKHAITWTSEILTPENKEYLKSLPEMWSDDLIMMVHGSPSSPIDEYLLASDRMKFNISHIKKQLVCFVGHSHVPFHYRYDRNKENDTAYQGELSQKSGTTMFNLDKVYKHFVNVGSVGQPRDEDWRTCCMVFNTESSEISCFRVEYDVKKVQDKMRGYKLPEVLINRLELGQ
ncbi:MAG: metallophosphoesterase family protein [Elusimicrobiota bacterium]